MGSYTINAGDCGYPVFYEVQKIRTLYRTGFMMNIKVCLCISGWLTCLSTISGAQTKAAMNLDFEYVNNTSQPLGWSFFPTEKYRIYADSSVAMSGKHSLRIEAVQRLSQGDAATYYTWIPDSLYKNKDRIKVVAYFHIEGADPARRMVSLSLNQQQGVNPHVASARSAMDTVAIKNVEWERYEIDTELDHTAKRILLFANIEGAIRNVWTDAYEIYIDGNKIADLPVLRELPKQMDINWLSDNVKELKYLSPDNYKDNSDIDAFVRSVGDARVVALGEATHGTHEFLTLRDRLIRTLVQTKGFNVIAFESGMAEADSINNLVPANTDSVAAVINDNTLFRIYQCREVQDMVAWVKSWNLHHRSTVQISGLDMQGNKGAAAGIKIFGSIHDTVLLLKQQHIDSLPITFRDPYLRDSLVKLSEDLLSYFNEHLNRYKTIVTVEQLNRIAKLTGLQNQTFRFRTIRDKDRYLRFRDSCMAVNAKWLLEQDPKNKIIILAHNEHTGIDFSLKNSLGYYLNQYFGPSYKSYAFLTGEGEFTSYNQYGLPEKTKLEAPYDECYEYYLEQLKQSDFFWELKDNTAKILTKELRMRIAGVNSKGKNQFGLQDIEPTYHGIFFIRKTTASQSFFYNFKY
jgi:erythromycin esterase